MNKGTSKVAIYLYHTMREPGVFSMLLLIFSVSTVTSQCPDVHISDTKTVFIEGTYIGSTVDCSYSTRWTYVHEEGPYYLYYYRGYWYVGSIPCSDDDDVVFAKVTSRETYPEEIDEDWREKIDGVWRENDDMEVDCHEENSGLSTGAVIGITIGVLLFVALMVLVILFICYLKNNKKRTTVQSDPHIGLQAECLDQMSRDPIPAYASPGYDLSMNGKHPSHDFNGGLYFNSSPPAYAECVIRPQQSRIPPPYSTGQNLDVEMNFVGKEQANI